MAQTEATKERQHPAIATVDADKLTVQFADRGTYREALRIINERGIELYGQELNKK